MLELGFSHRAAILASFFTIFGKLIQEIIFLCTQFQSPPLHTLSLPGSLDNSLVIQSRVIMLDSFLIFFTYLSILCFLKFYHKRHRYIYKQLHKNWEWDLGMRLPWMCFSHSSLGHSLIAGTEGWSSLAVHLDCSLGKPLLITRSPKIIIIIFSANSLLT